MQFRSGCILHSATFATILRPLRFCSSFRSIEKVRLLTAKFAEKTQCSQRINRQFRSSCILHSATLATTLRPLRFCSSFRSNEKRVFINREVRREGAKFAEDLSCNSDQVAFYTLRPLRQFCALCGFALHFEA